MVRRFWSICDPIKLTQLPILLGFILSPIQGLSTHCHRSKHSLPPEATTIRSQLPTPAACRHSLTTFLANSKKKKKKKKKKDILGFFFFFFFWFFCCDLWFNSLAKLGTIWLGLS
jgi:hypothetical protein